MPNEALTERRLHPPGDGEGKVLNRLNLIEEALVVGHPTQICRREGTTPQTLRNWMRRYRLGGVRALLDQPRSPSSGRPKSLRSGTQDPFLELVRRSPRSGCLPLAKAMAVRGVRVSPPTVQKFLNVIDLGRQGQRQAWVDQGCPTKKPAPSPLLGRTGAQMGFGLAKRLYFFGIPGMPIRSPVVRFPTLQSVAARTNLKFE